MKIAQVTHSFPPYMSGTGNACYNYAIELAKLGHDVTVFTCDYPGQEYEYPDSIKVKRLPYLFKLGNAPFMPGLFKLKGFDVIQLHYPFFFGAEMIYIVAKLRHIKYIISYHNDAVAKGLFGLYFTIYRHTIMKLVLAGSSKIIVSSLDYGRNSFIKNWIDHHKEKIVEIPYGIDIGRFSCIDGSDVKARYDLNDKTVVLFVGGLDKPHFFKGVDYLIKSIAKIKNDNIKLLIVGEGDLKEHYIDIAEEEGAESRVIFAGRVSDSDLPKFYAACDMLVLPSITMGEAFGIVLLEAMATGKPVIASNLPGVRTVIDDGVNGFLVEPKDTDILAKKIEYLQNNKELGYKLGINGLLKIKEIYSWDIINKELESVLKDVRG